MSWMLSLVVAPISLVATLSGCGASGQEPAQRAAVTPAQAVVQEPAEPPHEHSRVAWSDTPRQDAEEPGQTSSAANPAPTHPAPVPHTPPQRPVQVQPPTPAPPPPAPVPRPSTPALAPQYQQILSAHNQVRAKHCAQPLRWSQQLEAVAQDWADQLAGANCAFEHRPKNRFGENLTFFAPVGSQSPAGVAQGWYSEVQQYNFANGQFDFQTGHFTQVVWTSTTELGCGVSRCNGGEIWVCNYNPPGNMMGDFDRGVLHPSQCDGSAK